MTLSKNKRRQDTEMRAKADGPAFARIHAAPNKKRALSNR